MEPNSTGMAAGAAGWKAIGGLAGAGAIGSGLAAIVVMIMLRPKTVGEWVVALVCTVMGSVGGGSYVVMHFGLQGWAESYLGLVSLGGLMFACGLPGWTIVRAFFIWAERRRDADLAQIAQELKEMM